MVLMKVFENIEIDPINMGLILNIIISNNFL